MPARDDIPAGSADAARAVSAICAAGRIACSLAVPA